MTNPDVYIGEARNELRTFMKAYETAANSRDFSLVEPMIAEDAEFWFTDGAHQGIEEIRLAFEQTYEHIRDEIYSISNVNWLLEAHEMAACSYDFSSDGLVNGQRQVVTGHGTTLLKKIDGNWRIIHEHLSRSPDA